MIILSRLTRLLALAIFLGTAATASAEQVAEFGDYRIHYNAFVSTMLSPEVARAYGLKRSRYQAVVNITVQKKENSDYRPVSAKVSGTAINLYGEQRNLDMKKVTEQEAIYYLAELPFSNEEILNFNIEVVPEGDNIVRNINFKQQFFVD